MPDVAAGRLPVPARLRQQVFRGSDAVAEGLISATRLRKEYRRVLHGVYVPPGTSIDHGVRTLAALLCLPDAAVLTGHSAAWWYGVPYAEPAAPVIAIVPKESHRGGPRGVKVFRGQLNPDDVAVVNGMRMTTPARTAWDAATLTDPPSALAIVDGLLRMNLVTSEQLRQMIAKLSGTWGVSRARPVFELADGRSESPAESWTRWLLHSTSLPPVTLQFEVFDDDGKFIARVDFAWPANKIALEYDGSYHADPVQLAADQRRDAALALLGWTVIRMTSSDLHDPSRVLTELRKALAR